MKEFFIPLADGKRVFARYYHEHKDTKTIVYLHGGPGDNCENFNYAAHQLAEKINVLMFDQRGVLRSDRVGEDEKLTVNMLVDDCESVRKALHIPKIILLGHSYGGLIALLYARRYPESTEGIIYENPNWSSVDAMKAILKHHCDYLLSVQEDALCDEIYARMEKVTDLCQLEDILTSIPENYREIVYYNKPWSPEMLEYCHFDTITEEQWHNSEIHHEKIMKDPINNVNFLKDTAKVSCPQILLRGDHDPVFPDGFQEWFSTHTNGIVKTVSDCGHYIHTAKPQDFCQAVWGFIDRL